MNRTSLVLVSLILGVALPWTNVGAGHAAAPRLVSTAFHVRLPAGISPGTTIWVAYGPVAGKFGIIRMHSISPRQYAASAKLPRGSRATFYYVEGQGTIHTRAGLAPGNPTRTLGRVGPVVIGRQPVPLFTVPAPLG